MNGFDCLEGDGTSEWFVDATTVKSIDAPVAEAVTPVSIVSAFERTMILPGWHRDGFGYVLAAESNPPILKTQESRSTFEGSGHD